MQAIELPDRETAISCARMIETPALQAKAPYLDRIEDESSLPFLEALFPMGFFHNNLLAPDKILLHEGLYWASKRCNYAPFFTDGALISIANNDVPLCLPFFAFMQEHPDKFVAGHAVIATKGSSLPYLVPMIKAMGYLAPSRLVLDVFDCLKGREQKRAFLFENNRAEWSLIVKILVATLNSGSICKFLLTLHIRPLMELIGALINACADVQHLASAYAQLDALAFSSSRALLNAKVEVFAMASKQSNDVAGCLSALSKLLFHQPTDAIVAASFYQALRACKVWRPRDLESYQYLLLMAETLRYPWLHQKQQIKLALEMHRKVDGRYTKGRIREILTCLPAYLQNPRFAKCWWWDLEMQNFVKSIPYRLVFGVRVNLSLFGPSLGLTRLIDCNCAAFQDDRESALNDAIRLTSAISKTRQSLGIEWSDIYFALHMV